MELMAGRRRVAVGEHVHRRDQHVVRVEAGRKLLRGGQLAQEQGCADEQHEADRHLRDDERAAQAIGHPPAARRRGRLPP